jgi:hypothetical protein
MSDLTELLKIILNALFIFTAVSYISCAATEGLTALFRRRETLLARAVAELLGDKRFDDLALEVYGNPYVNPLGNGTVASKAELGALPAWIDPALFATVLLEVLHIIPNTPTSMGKIQPLPVDRTLRPPRRIENAITNVTRRIGADAEVDGKAHSLIQLMTNLIHRCRGRRELMEQSVALWFDVAMRAVTEQYRREIKLWNFVIGFGIAALLDLRPIPVSGLLAPGSQGAQVMPLLAQMFEWGVVALSTLFGAQLWFSLLKSAAGRGSKRAAIPAPAALPLARVVKQPAPTPVAASRPA